jgi:ATP-dependent DNA helicase RecG
VLLNHYLVGQIIPESLISVSQEVAEGKDIIVVDVLSGSKKPYVFDGKIYIRRNGKTFVATANEISRLIIARQSDETHWERQPCLGIEIKDLDTAQIIKTIQNLNKNGRGKEQTENIEEFLMRYNLYQNGYLTNAAVVLFAKTPIRYISQSRVRISVYPTGKTGKTFEYDEFLEGNIFENINKIEQFFAARIGTASLFRPESWQRLDRQLYPTHALREGVLNALIHRDYENRSGSVTIVFYADRVEITNYGELPKGLKVADLKKQHLSLPTNPDIAHVCYLHGLIEKAGRGTLNILSECKESGYAAPTWKCDMGATFLTFYSAFTETKIELNNRQKKVLEQLKTGQTFTSKDYVKMVFELLQEAIAERTARQDLVLLKKENLLEMTGKANAVQYKKTGKIISD